MILVPANKVEKIKYFSTHLGLIFIEITRGLLRHFNYHNATLSIAKLQILKEQYLK